MTVEKSENKSSSSHNTESILSKSFHRAIGGGASGAAAMGVQVVSLMWLRTAVNYQYRHGSTMSEVLYMHTLSHCKKVVGIQGTLQGWRC